MSKVLAGIKVNDNEYVLTDDWKAIVKEDNPIFVDNIDDLKIQVDAQLQTPPGLTRIKNDHSYNRNSHSISISDKYIATTDNLELLCKYAKEFGKIEFPYHLNHSVEQQIGIKSDDDRKGYLGSVIKTGDYYSGYGTAFFDDYFLEHCHINYIPGIESKIVKYSTRVRKQRERNQNCRVYTISELRGLANNIYGMIKPLEVKKFGQSLVSELNYDDNSYFMVYDALKHMIKMYEKIQSGSILPYNAGISYSARGIVNWFNNTKDRTESTLAAIKNYNKPPKKYTPRKWVCDICSSCVADNTNCQCHKCISKSCWKCVQHDKRVADKAAGKIVSKETISAIKFVVKWMKKQYAGA